MDQIKAYLQSQKSSFPVTNIVFNTLILMADQVKIMLMDGNFVLNIDEWK